MGPLFLRGRTLRTAFGAGATWAAGTTAPAFATWAAHAAGTFRTLRTVFIWGEFAVAVLIEFLQRLGGFRKFVGVDDAVAV